MQRRTSSASFLPLQQLPLAAAGATIATASASRRRVLACLAALAFAFVLFAGGARRRAVNTGDGRLSSSSSFSSSLSSLSSSPLGNDAEGATARSSPSAPSSSRGGIGASWRGKASTLMSSSTPSRASTDAPTSSTSTPSFCLRADPLPWPGAHHLVDDAYGPETAPFASCAAIPSGTLRSSSPPSSPPSSSATSAACRDSLFVPSVALLFLTRGPMPFESLWKEWLLQVQGMLPLYCVAASACANGGWNQVRALRSACGGSTDGKSLDPHQPLGQRLFRVYTHAPPSFPGYPRESPFHGTLIEDRLSTTWGDHSMMEATRRLLQAALSSGENQRFMLLSESCSPIYHPAVVHQQLVHERLSRVDACAADGSDGLPVSTEDQEGRERAGDAEERRRQEASLPPPRPRNRPTKNLFWERWSWRFEEAGVSRGAWRKSAQWWSLTREAADAVVRDATVVSAFAEVCRFEQDHDNGEWRSCVADESYVPTLLAVTRKGESKGESGSSSSSSSSTSSSSSSSPSARPQKSATSPQAHNLRYRHLTLASTTDCYGYVTATDWSKTGPWQSHPLTFGDGKLGGDPATAVDARLIRDLRRQDQKYVVCDGDAVTELALRSYARPSEWPADEDAAKVDPDDDVEVRGRGLDDVEGRGDVVGNATSASSWRVTVGPYPSIRKFGYVCPLFARKFAPQAAGALAAALADPSVRALGVARVDLSRAGPAPPSPNLSIKTEAWAEEDGGGAGKKR